MDILAVLKSAKLFICVIVFPLHGLGLYVVKYWRSKSTQLTVLMSLSSAEIIHSLGNMIMQFVSVVYHQKDSYNEAVYVENYNKVTIPDSVIHLYEYLICVGIIQVNFSLILLTIERLVCIVLPRKYSVAAENLKVYKKLLICSWCYSVLFSFCTLFQVNKDKNISKWFVITQTALVILVIFCSYLSIGIHVVRSRRAVHTSSNRISTTLLLVPVCIISTYILSYVVPYPIIAWLIGKKGSVQRNHAIALSLSYLPPLGSIVNMLIYVILTNDNMTSIASLCCRCQGNHREENQGHIELRSIVMENAHLRI